MDSPSVTRQPISNLRSGRASIAELLMVALALALSVNLLSASLSEYFGARVGLYLGILLAVLSLFYLVARYIWPRRSNLTIDCVFGVLNSESIDLVSVPNYKFSTDVCEALRAVFKENPALARQWKEEPIYGSPIPDDQARNPTRQEPSGLRLLNEAAEFVVLHSLSMHLSGYFVRNNLGDSKLKTYHRADVPDVILKNRVLDIISRDPADRPGLEDVHPNVIMVLGEQYYSRFDMTLPQGAEISRLANGSVQLSTRGLTLTVKSDCRGFGASVPRKCFDTKLVGTDVWSTSWIDVPVRVETRVSLALAFFGRRWIYYQWVESFISAVEQQFSFTKYLRDINWPALEALLSLRESPKWLEVESLAENRDSDNP